MQKRFERESRQNARRYTLSGVKPFRKLLKRLRGAPPTGPLTTSETADAEELRQETLTKNDKRIKREQREAGGESNSSSE